MSPSPLTPKPTAPASYTVTGSVKDAAGQPVASARITVSDPPPNPNAGKTASANTDGRYTLSDLALADFTIVVSSPGFRDVEHSIPLASGNAAAASDFVLAVPAVDYSLTGLVTGASGSPIAGAGITVVETPGGINNGKRTTTAGDGRYRLDGLAPGTFAVAVSADGHESTTRSVTVEAGQPSPAADFVLTPSRGSYAIRGTVRGEGGAPIASATVLITDGSTGPNGGHSGVSDGSGTYVISGLTLSAVNTVTASANGYQSSTRNVALTTGVDSVTADFVLLVASTSTPTPTIAYSLQGVVRSVAGTPIAGATVLITDSSANSNRGRNATTDTGGRYVIPNLESSAVNALSISAPGYQPGSRDVALTADVATATADVMLTPVPATNTYSIGGIVRGQTGTIAGAVVRISSPAGGSNYGRFAISDINGRYAIDGLEFSSVTGLTASSAGFQQVGQTVTMTASVASVTADFLLIAVPVTVDSVQGIVTSAAGTPIAGAAVAVDGGPNPNSGRSAVTNAAGAFSLTGLVNANFLLTASASGFLSSTQTVLTDVPGPTVTVNFVLIAVPPAAMIITFDRLGATGTPYSGHSEAGFRVATTAASWVTNAYVGQPSSVVFNASAGSRVVGSLIITGDGRPFTFKSVDLYSSVTLVPYAFVGRRNGAVVFQLNGTGGAHGGSWATTTNSVQLPIDSLEISLTNDISGAVSGTNPMGVDNLVLSY